MRKKYKVGNKNPCADRDFPLLFGVSAKQGSGFGQQKEPQNSSKKKEFPVKLDIK